MKKIFILIVALLSSSLFSSVYSLCIRRKDKDVMNNTSLSLYSFSDTMPQRKWIHTSHASHVSHYSCFRDSFVANLSEKKQEAVINKIMKNENIKIKQDAKNYSYARIKNLYMFQDTAFAQPLKCLYVNLYFFGNPGSGDPFEYMYKFDREYFFPLIESENNVYIHERYGAEGFKIKHYTIKKNVWIKEILKNLRNE